VVDEVFTPAGRVGPVVVGRAEGMEVEPGMRLVLEDERGRATVHVISVEFATPRSLATGRTTLVISSRLDGRVRPGAHLTPGGRETEGVIGMHVDLYCKVFVHAPDHAELLAAVGQVVDGEVSRRTVDGGGLVIDVLPNDDHDESRAAGGAGDFLHFPYVLDIEATDGDEVAFVAAVAHLADGLRARGYDFVTAGDVEELLPHRGRTDRPTT
jgi:hypothetical protein